MGGITLSVLNAVSMVVVPVGVFVFYARELTQVDLGAVVFAIAWIEIMKAAAPLGFYEALLSHDFRQNADRAVGGLLLVCGLAGWLAFALLMYFSQGRFAGGMPGIWQLLVLMGGKLFFDIIVTQPLAELARRREYAQMATRTMVSMACSVPGSLLVNWIFGPIYGFVSYYLLMSALTWVTTVIGTGSIARPTFKWSELRGLRRTALMASQVRALAIGTNFLDQLLVGYILGPANIALYSVGKRAEMAQSGAAAAISTSLYQPLFARRSDARLSDDYQNAAVFLLIMFGLPAVVLTVNANRLVEFVFGKHLLLAAPLMAAFAVGGFARVLSGLQGAYLSVAGRNSLLRNRSLISFLAGVPIVLAVHTIGLEAMSWALAAKNILICLWGFGMTREIAGFRFFFRVVALTFASGLIAGWAMRALAERAIDPSNPGGLISIWTISALGSAAAFAFIIGWGRLARLRQR